MANPATITLRQLFRYYRSLPHQTAAIGELEDDLAANGYSAAMRRDRPWFATWSQDGKQPEASASPAWPSGVVGPKKQPDLQPGDHHLVADDINKTLTAWTHQGRRLWRVPCLCRGQGGEAEWDQTGSDTPPGLYLLGQVYRDYEEDPTARFTADRCAYGWYSFDLIGQEGQEGPASRPYRDGIMIHGGGSTCGWPGAWAPRQPLYPTLGCIRCHNQDLRDRILPLVAMGRVWVSVLQEAR